MTELNFDSMLAQIAADYQKAEPMSDYMPPDGRYTVMLTDLNKGVKQKEEGPLIWLSVKAKLLDAANPEIDGKAMTLGFFSNKALGVLKGFVQSLVPPAVTDPADMVNTDDLVASIAYIEKRIVEGTILNIEVKTRRTLKGEFTNIQVLEVVPEVSQVSVDEAPAVQ